MSRLEYRPVQGVPFGNPASGNAAMASAFDRLAQTTDSMLTRRDANIALETSKQQDSIDQQFLRGISSARNQDELVQYLKGAEGNVSAGALEKALGHHSTISSAHKSTAGALQTEQTTGYESEDRNHKNIADATFADTVAFLRGGGNVSDAQKGIQEATGINLPGKFFDDAVQSAYAQDNETAVIDAKKAQAFSSRASGTSSLASANKTNVDANTAQYNQNKLISNDKIYQNANMDSFGANILGKADFETLDRQSQVAQINSPVQLNNLPPSTETMRKFFETKADRVNTIEADGVWENVKKNPFFGTWGVNTKEAFNQKGKKAASKAGVPFEVWLLAAEETHEVTPKGVAVNLGAIAERAKDYAQKSNVYANTSGVIASTDKQAILINNSIHQARISGNEEAYNVGVQKLAELNAQRDQAIQASVLMSESGYGELKVPSTPPKDFPQMGIYVEDFMPQQDRTQTVTPLLMDPSERADTSDFRQQASQEVTPDENFSAQFDAVVNGALKGNTPLNGDSIPWDNMPTRSKARIDKMVSTGDKSLKKLSDEELKVIPLSFVPVELRSELAQEQLRIEEETAAKNVPDPKSLSYRERNRGKTHYLDPLFNRNN